MEPLLFELGARGRSSLHCSLSQPDESMIADMLPSAALRTGLDLPELTEREVVQHFVRLSQMNYGLDSGFYPLGSCTMKYNPRVNEDVATFTGFTQIHPLQPDETVQGALELMYELQRYLAEISGLAFVSLQPAAGAHGELTGLMVIGAYHRDRGEGQRDTILVPDSAHGTNPATAAVCGYRVVSVRSNDSGGIDLDDLRRVAGEHVSALMITIPNTLGLFDKNILEIADIVHCAGALLYCDGANLNAIIGQVRPGDLGCDAMHLNLHKTFGTPHGGGGPGAGPIAVRESLAPFLPSPIVAKRDSPSGDYYFMDNNRPLSIGKVRSFHGNFSVLIKAYAYIRSLGSFGLEAVSENAVLNANYLMHLLRNDYDIPYGAPCMHEFVLSGRRQKDRGVRTLDIAKRIMDFGFHPPTVYFPSIVEEALMIEPTETETRATLEAFGEAMVSIAHEAVSDAQMVRSAPHVTRVGRLDETKAARHLVLRWRPNHQLG